MFDTNFGSALAAEIDYRRERLVQAGSGSRRVRRDRARRATRALSVNTKSGRIGPVRTAH